jgi:hypothetical protein
MAGNLESQVSVLCLNPTGVAASISGGILRCDRASGDPVEKQVFADCPDRSTWRLWVERGHWVSRVTRDRETSAAPTPPEG